MKIILRSVAAMELLFVFPAVLFMTALFARNIQPLQYEPAHTAQRIVDWYAASPHIGLWVLLIALPLAGGGYWYHNPDTRVAPQPRIARPNPEGNRIHSLAGAYYLIAGATAMALGILAIVALHVLTD